MGHHYHLCLRTPEGNLSRVMRHLDGLYTQRFNRSYGRDGPLFRGRYKAILVEADTYLAAVIRYIHLNPVAAKLVRRPAGETVLQAVARAYDLPVEALRTGQRGHANEARKVAMYLVKRLCDLTLAETAARFGVSSYGSVAWATLQVRHAAHTDAAIRRRLHRIERDLNQPKT